ncbi:hypothetical protein [Actinomadura litoris]|uniref:Uncharacterized protein n=1 Tax=Actinomadura litoris TaxID=2678616 RepID=A0A7K1LB63_9ACTN|nr:hypothetical protein [Actinomadura litoris]MUN41425.1 hypothetical protein [Actinomadura litoris]
MRATRKQPEPPDVNDAANMLAGGLADIREALGPLDETVRGYRDQLQRDGWSTAAAEQMAITLHQLMLARLFTEGG